MSSSMNSTACEECGERQRLNFCVDCDTTFCAQCWSKERAHAPGKVNRDGIPHEMLPNKEVITRLKDIFTPPNDPELQRKLHKSDAESKWFGVTTNSDDDPVLHDYGRFPAIMRESSTGYLRRWPQLVSFVGQTGAGKSTLIKVLVDYQTRSKNIQGKDEFPSPVAGSANAHAPTSGDVHLYSDPGSYHSEHPILYADCEGMDGGEKVPISAQHTQGNDTSSWKPTIPSFIQNKPAQTEPKKLRKENKAGKRALKWANTPEKRKREFAVKNLYPRILYAFSDIIVFVLRNDRTFESAALVPLLQWADSSVESSVNQSAMPHVIIVLNCADPGIDQTGWTVESTTSTLLSTYANAVSENPHVKELSTFWQERGKVIKITKDLLHCYYSSVTVVRVPQKGRYGLVDAQIAELSLQIQRKCEDARENRKRLRVSFNAEEFQQALSMGFDHFSNRLNEPLDFVQISCTSNPIPPNFGGNILRLALAMKDDPRMAGKTGRDIFQLLGHMVASCIMLDYVRHEIKGTPSRLLLHYKSSYSVALKVFCERFWPCTFTYKGTRCVNTQQGHARGHQDSDGRFIWDGPYESADNFTKQTFEQEWHKMLESNLDLTRERMSKMMRGEIAMEEQSAATELHLERINEFYSHLGAPTNYANHAACFCCLREFPEHPLPCGHVLCTPCVRSFAHRKNTLSYAMEWCPLHRHELWDEEWEIAVKPDLAGVRILTLDGGGVRGIIELQVLAEIQQHLGQLPIASFFDLIVGTSTGGIIGLGLGVKEWPIDECIRKFETLCSTAFTPRFVAGLQQMASVVLKRSKYKTEPFNDALREHFGEDQLFGGKCPERRYQRKVAVVSTSGTGQEAVILANYNRPQRDAEPSYKFERPQNDYAEIKIWEACRATSAAPSYFKSFINPRSGLIYIDGALYYNNPARVAHQECKLLWPDMEGQAPDIMLSIGSSWSHQEKEPRTAGARTYKVALNRFDNLLDAQIAWDQFEQEVREPDEIVNSRYIRLNPKMPTKVKLDDVGQFQDLKSRVDDTLKNTRWNIEARTVARRLIASSFFFEKDVNFKDKDIVQGWICCRFPDESAELRHLGHLLRHHQSKHFSPFFMICEEDEENHGSLRFITKEVIAAMIHESTFKIDMLEIRPSFELARTTISLCLSKDGEMFAISGFPRHIGSNVLQNRRPRRKDGPARASAKGKHTQGNQAEGDGSTDPSTLNLREQLWSSNENLPIPSPDEDIPFWARGFHGSFPTSINDSVERPDTPTSTETVANTYCDSPLESLYDRSDSTTSIQSGNVKHQNRHQIPPEDYSVEGFAPRPQMGEHVTRSDSRVHQSSFRSRIRTPDVSSTRNSDSRDDCARRPRSLENLSSYAAFVLEDEPPTSSATDIDQNMEELDLGKNSGPSAMVVGMELAKQESLKTARVPTSPAMALESLETSLPAYSVSASKTPSTASSRCFQNIAYSLRQSGDSIPRAVGSPTLYDPMSSYDMKSNQTSIPDPGKSERQSPQGIENPPPVITDMTEEEIYQIAKMRSMEFC